ncbi:MAG: hypothetical protein WBW06_21180, partial [Xanthobacteraceae bacterium]
AGCRSRGGGESEPAIDDATRAQTDGEPRWRDHGDYDRPIRRAKRGRPDLAGANAWTAANTSAADRVGASTRRPGSIGAAFVKRERCAHPVKLSAT